MLHAGWVSGNAAEVKMRLQVFKGIFLFLLNW